MMRTMKPKAKLKKKDARYGKMKLANGQSADETSDLSQLRKPVDINLSSLKQVAELFEKGSDEVKAILNYECDIIYECKICRSLFRSLANLISHKRAYCIEKHCFVPRRRDVDSTDSTFDLELALDPELRKNCTNDRILRSQSQLMHVEPKKDLTSVIDMLTKKQNNAADDELSSKGSSNTSPMRITSDDEQIVLEIMDSQQAAYQTVSRFENVATGELMKNQTLELRGILNQTTGVLGPDGELIEVCSLSKNEHLADDEEAMPLDDRLVANRDIVCTTCNARFATKKTLTFHMKSKHLPHRTGYTCPYCTSTFTNRWSVYRHLFKVHRKTNEQVRKIRSQIQARPYKKEISKVDKNQKTNGTQRGEDKVDEEQPLNSAKDDLESEAEPRDCKRCGKRFERKAMLISHYQNCPNRAEGMERRRARKIPPQRNLGLVETAMNVVAVGNNDQTKGDNSEECKTTTAQMSDSEISQVSFSSEKCTTDLSNQEPESSPLSGKSPPSPFKRKSTLTSMNVNSESLPIDRESKSSSADQKSDSSAINEIAEFPLSTRKAETFLLDKKSESSTSRRKSRLISINEKSESCSTNTKLESSSVGRRSKSSSKRKQKLVPISQKSKPSPIDRKSRSPAIIRRKSKLSSTDEKSTSITTDRETTKSILRHKESESILGQRKSGSIDRFSEPNSIDQRSESSTTSRKLKTALIDRESEFIPTDKKSQLASRNQKSVLNSTDEKSELISKNRKFESSSIESDLAAMEKAGLSTIITSVPAEISIRVEEVSSLSKDVWDKMGTSDEAATGDFTPENTESPIICSPVKKLADSSIKTTEKSCKSGSDIPEVIYTSIDNSRQVELSVLSKEKKLGIQYRGIRLPTVTLEKINVPRARAKESERDVAASVPMEKPEIEAIPGTQQHRNFQCLPCNRRFTSAANLRKHISAHVRRDRYRCKLCNDFKSLLKCDVVAHCNTVHNTRNDRNLLAELVVEEPIHGDTSIDDINHVIGTRGELEIIDVGSASKKQRATDVPVDGNAIVVDETTKRNEIEGSTNVLTDAVEYVPAHDPRPKRGRPPNVKNKTKRGRKKRVFGRKRVLRHVSPPRLPDEPSDEVPPVLEILEEPSENLRQLSHTRAPSRMDCDPELRKMVMEVIFGSSENNRNSQEIDHDSREFYNDSHSVNDDFDQIIGCREKLVPSPPSLELTDPNIISINFPEGNRFVNQLQIPNSANNNLLLQHCHNYELTTITDNHDPIVFSKQSNYVAIQVSTENPLVRQTNSLSPMLKHENSNDHLVEAQQTEMIVCAEK